MNARRLIIRMRIVCTSQIRRISVRVTNCVSSFLRVGRYDKYFKILDVRNCGVVSITEAGQLFSKAQLDEDSLKDIFELADIGDDNLMTLPKFRVAMHLATEMVQGHDLPETLPESLARSAGMVVGDRGAGAGAGGDGGFCWGSCAGCGCVDGGGSGVGYGFSGVPALGGGAMGGAEQIAGIGGGIGGGI
eukprot:6172736-Pleurochrysis_carterae.AAC.2